MEQFYLKKEGGCLIWITGLPGAGKTTLANKTYELIKDITPTVCIDGDVIREIMGDDLGYDPKSRKLNAWRLARLSGYLVGHHLTVICSTVSLIKEIHQWNRENVKNLIEVYIEVPMGTLIQRDQKNLYSRALHGEIGDMYAINQSYEIPEKPDLIIKNDGELDSFIKNAHYIKDLILNKK